MNLSLGTNFICKRFLEAIQIQRRVQFSLRIKLSMCKNVCVRCALGSAVSWCVVFVVCYDFFFVLRWHTSFGLWESKKKSHLIYPNRFASRPHTLKMKSSRINGLAYHLINWNAFELGICMRIWVFCIWKKIKAEIWIHLIWAYFERKTFVEAQKILKCSENYFIFLYLFIFLSKYLIRKELNRISF